MKIEKWKWVYNPFEKIAGWKAFGIGLIFLCATIVTGYFGNTVFYGLSAKTVPTVTWSMAFLLQALSLSVTVIIMYVTALIFAKHVRFQDILGTVTLAKYPNIVLAIILLAFGNNIILKTGMYADNPENLIKTISEFTALDYTVILIFAVIVLTIIVWHIALLFNAFRVSANLKGVKCTVLFIAAMLLSEILNSILILVIKC